MVNTLLSKVGLFEEPSEDGLMWGIRYAFSILEKGKYLDKVIEIIEKDINKISTRGKNEYFLEFMDSWESGVKDHLFNQICEEGYFDDKDFCNFLSDVLRYLKRFKNNEPLYLLSDKEKKDGSRFLRRLEYPPSRNNPLLPFYSS
jgi:hypothetical protein